MNVHISIKNVGVRYEKTAAVNNVSLDIPRGAATVIVGESGCGKSTLLRVVAGLQKPTVGEVKIFGDKTKIAFMPQTYGLMPWQTARENILLPRRLGKGLGFWRKDKLSAADEERFNDLLQKLGIAEITERYPRELSGGQKQRVALARVFFARLPILLMDEPFSALDAITREEIGRVFGALRKKVGMTTLLVTHDVNEALTLADEIVIMKKDSQKGGQIFTVLDGAADFGETGRETPEFFGKANKIRRILAEIAEK